ncbi:restriction endonuclease [Poseidonibacter lekithochrous]|uniref:restriction endonuclease n=1 Tax=Poseidonibacter lekithochrous TaxID=1904463 RepID=UPI000D346721|nr:restriction endonuclease [Poseidonibacter lekithochrous]
MSLTKKSPQWKQYEWLITKIFHDNSESKTETVLHDAKIIGEYSESSRQIDVLIENNNIKTIIECKHHSRPVDLKGLADFLEIFSDVKANFGILISSSGFTKSVHKRIKEFEGQITLENIDWEKAYSSFQEQSYGRITDLCNNCIDNYISGKEVPGLLCWEHGLGIEVNDKVSMYSIGKCLKCNNHTVYCDSCGWITIAEHEESCCKLRDIFIDLYNKT